MSEKFGLPLNESECKLLISIATKCWRESLDCHHFCELIFKDDFFNYLIDSNFIEKQQSMEEFQKDLLETSAQYEKNRILNKLCENI